MATTDTETEKLQNDVVAYLKGKGWGVALIGEVKIQQPDPRLKNKFEVCIGFVGKAGK